MHHDDLIEKIYDQDVLELILADTLAQKYINIEKIRQCQKEFKRYED